MHEIPEIAVQILEHRDLAVILGSGLADEVDAGFCVGGVIAGEIVGGEEQEDAAAGLVADRLRLFGRGGAGEEDGGGVLQSVGWPDGDPAFVLF